MRFLAPAEDRRIVHGTKLSFATPVGDYT
jgi:hypothetical protein